MRAMQAQFYEELLPEYRKLMAISSLPVCLLRHIRPLLYFLGEKRIADRLPGLYRLDYEGLSDLINR